jgi:hypothetical protein
MLTAVKIIILSRNPFTIASLAQSSDEAEKLARPPKLKKGEGKDKYMNVDQTTHFFVLRWSLAYTHLFTGCLHKPKDNLHKRMRKEDKRRGRGGKLMRVCGHRHYNSSFLVN